MREFEDGTNFIFYTVEFWHIKVLHFYRVQTETSVIQELIHVGYQQSK